MKVKEEIEVVENMIRLLNECLVISKRHKRKYEVKNIENDLEVCKAELKKLLDQKGEAHKNLKGEAEGAAI
jgi:hypothetical protein